MQKDIDVKQKRSQWDAGVPCRIERVKTHSEGYKLYIFIFLLQFVTQWYVMAELNYIVHTKKSKTNVLNFLKNKI
jgi:uncharacterized sporulation protein YeaH/YhbH (DUF444 family)